MYMHTYTFFYKLANICFICTQYVWLYPSVYQFSLEKFNWKYMQANMCLYVLQNFALFVSRLRKSSFISRQHLINNSKPITSLSSSILWSLSTSGAGTAKVMRGTFTVFFFTFCDFWCDNNEKSPQASTSFQACVRIHLSSTVPDNTSFVETV